MVLILLACKGGQDVSVELNVDAIGTLSRRAYK